MKTPDHIQRVLDKGKAQEIAEYVRKKNRKSLYHYATLRDVCVRFRLNQTDAKRIIDSVDFLYLSDLAYKPPRKGATFGQALMASWHPTIWEDAPDGSKLVSVIDPE
jgi:hypothetical protein